jgi:ankyrin repeat protein
MALIRIRAILMVLLLSGSLFGTTKPAVVASPNVKYLNHALIAAVKASDGSKVNKLLQSHANANCFLQSGLPIFTLAMLQGGLTPKNVGTFGLVAHNHSIAELLLNHGARIDGTNKYGETALLVMCKALSLDDVTFLLQHGANVKDQDMFGNSALHCATMNYISYLPSTNAQARSKRFTVEHKLIDLLTAKGVGVDSRNKAGVTPLMNASLTANSDAVGYLITRGASVSTVAKNGETPLICAIEATDLMTVGELLKHGANPNQSSKIVAPALFWAIRYDQHDLIQLLIQYHADPNQQYYIQGSTMTPISYAIKYKLNDLLPLLHVNK